MKKCSYCRCEFEGSKCPNCGGSGKTISSESSFKKSSFMDTFTDNPSSFIRNESFNYDGIVGKAQSISRTIRYAIKTWIVCIILGLILSHFMKQGNVAFLEENHDIFVYVKNILLYFGWVVGILLSKIRRFI